MAKKSVYGLEGRAQADLRRAAEARPGAGQGVKACPCKTIVPLYRRHVIAQIKPATRTRIDFGLALGATVAPKRLDRHWRLQEKGSDHAPHRDSVAGRHRR
jgi:hypothetical protein